MNRTKCCTKCGIEKPLDEYHKHSTTKDGRRPDCKACYRTYQVTRYQANRDEEKARSARYYATNRKTVLLRLTRHRDLPPVKAQRAEYNARPEVKAYKAEYAAANPHIGWEHSYRQRAEQYGFGYLIPSMQSFTREELVWLHGDKCYHCGGEWTELDHWPLAISQGGMHALFNAVPSCLTCNRKSWRNRTTTQEKQHDR